MGGAFPPPNSNTFGWSFRPTPSASLKFVTTLVTNCRPWIKRLCWTSLPAPWIKRIGTHYRTLSTVEHRAERLFYEIEAERCGWSQPVLERQIHSHLFVRLLKSRDKARGLILCAERDEVVARYSVLHESEQLFASKYMLYLPTEAELRAEIAREQAAIEAARRVEG